MGVEQIVAGLPVAGTKCQAVGAVGGASRKNSVMPTVEGPEAVDMV